MPRIQERLIYILESQSKKNFQEKKTVYVSGAEKNRNINNYPYMYEVENTVLLDSGRKCVR